jgi:hypothetical protein
MNRIIAATAIAVGLSSGPAHAVCTLADIGGTWGFYGDLYTGNQGSALALSCTLHIDKTSGEVATDSACESTGVSNPGGYGTVTFGTFILEEPDNCTFSFRFGTDAGRNVSVEVRRSTLSENKQVLAGMISRPLRGLTGAGAIVTMIKIRSE